LYGAMARPNATGPLCAAPEVIKRKVR